ncbi:MAG: sensor histidine kinase, partial [Actinobacteria bacterium]|nr:sensor histidine kinase [Actinomycetota bacterium]
PPELDDGDLPGALATLAGRFTSGALVVTAEVDPGLELRDAAKLTVYHVASEALTNVHRHARATGCRIRVMRTEEGIELHVTDDGVGIDDVHRRIGVGTASMRERIEEIGGSLFVGPRVEAAREGEPPGTHVRALLPLSVCAA